MDTHPSDLETDPLVDIAVACRLLGGIGSATLYRHIRAGRLPRPIKVGGLSKWRRSAIENAVAKMEAAA